MCALTMVVMQPAQGQTAIPQHIEAVADRIIRDAMLRLQIPGLILGVAGDPRLAAYNDFLTLWKDAHPEALHPLPNCPRESVAAIADSAMPAT